MPFIHEDPGWPNLRWNEARLLALLAEIRHRRGPLATSIGGAEDNGGESVEIAGWGGRTHCLAFVFH